METALESLCCREVEVLVAGRGAHPATRCDVPHSASRILGMQPESVCAEDSIHHFRQDHGPLQASTHEYVNCLFTLPFFLHKVL